MPHFHTIIIGDLALGGSKVTEDTPLFGELFVNMVTNDALPFDVILKEFNTSRFRGEKARARLNNHATSNQEGFSKTMKCCVGRKFLVSRHRRPTELISFFT